VRCGQCSIWIQLFLEYLSWRGQFKVARRGALDIIASPEIAGVAQW
jgi:hypothetical protein